MVEEDYRYSTHMSQFYDFPINFFIWKRVTLVKFSFCIPESKAIQVWRNET